MVRSGRRHSSSPLASVVRYRLLRMSSPERSRNGSAGCRIAGSGLAVAGLRKRQQQRVRPCGGSGRGGAAVVVIIEVQTIRGNGFQGHVAQPLAWPGGVSTGIGQVA